MAYGDGGGSNLGNRSVTFKGFSSKADKKNFKLYDFEAAKQIGEADGAEVMSLPFPLPTFCLGTGWNRIH